ncbi:MAG: hypothetical protein K0Q91_1081 [Fibrobacteria bacterium]|jgi:uncharacterized protein (TIGR02147 family)|nr:hypothetical protein [Fibrobacteria bacterium]
MRQSSVSSPVSVFQFLDARDFLRQAYDAEKRLNKDFSQRYIAKAMGAGSSSFFKDVLAGRARLSPPRVAKFAKMFRLSPKETEYFENLVLFTQAENEAEKDRLLKKLSGDSSSGGYAILEAFQMEYLKKWHYAAVRELLAFTDFRDEYEELGKKLDPPITEAEAKNAIQVLLKLKLIRKNAQGFLEKVDKVVSTGISSAQVAAFKPGIRANLELAGRALDEFPAKIRPYSYLTLSVSEESFLQIRDILRATRRQILDLVARDPAVDRLYQLNMQLFPLSKTVKRRKS